LHQGSCVERCCLQLIVGCAVRWRARSSCVHARAARPAGQRAGGRTQARCEIGCHARRHYALLDGALGGQGSLQQLTPQRCYHTSRADAQGGKRGRDRLPEFASRALLARAAIKTARSIPDRFDVEGTFMQAGGLGRRSAPVAVARAPSTHPTAPRCSSTPSHLGNPAPAAPVTR